MIKLIIFDYDGVIVDSFANIHDVYKIMCTKLGKSCPEDVKEFRRVYGYNSSECYSNLGFSEEEKVKAEGIFKEEILKKEPKLFEGIIETLRELHKNYKLVVISSSHKEEVDQKLEKFHILEFFDDVIARENFIGRFEKTTSIKKVVGDSGLDLDEVLLIGDRNVDFVEGSKAGLSNIILVEYGWGYDLAKTPEYEQRVLVRNPREIIDALKKF